MNFLIRSLHRDISVPMSGININITTAENINDQSVSFFGKHTDVISNKEIESFDLDDESLKDAVCAYFGKRPDAVFLKSPTPWNDMYKTYQWSQVKRTLTPIHAEIQKETGCQPVIVSTAIFENNLNKQTTYSGKISHEVSTSLSSSRENSDSISMNQEISYNIASVSGGTSLSVVKTWGKNFSESKQVTLGSESGVEVTLDPGEKIAVDLVASKGLMRVKVTYEATLSGRTAVNYHEKFKNHHHWGFDINKVMEKGNLSDTIEISEIIDVGFYTKSKVVTRPL